jgi:hypothetical protein
MRETAFIVALLAGLAGGAFVMGYSVPVMAAPCGNPNCNTEDPVLVPGEPATPLGDPVLLATPCSGPNCDQQEPVANPADPRRPVEEPVVVACGGSNREHEDPVAIPGGSARPLGEPVVVADDCSGSRC